MIVLTREATLTAITAEMRQAPTAKIAVAFWGRSSSTLVASLVSKDVQILCNLESGACNPAEIEELMALFPERIRSNPRLHAKLWWTPNSVIIGSSNASANGLGLEGSETAGWLEANVRLSDPDTLASASAWFDREWEGSESRAISAAMLMEARSLWALRRQSVAMQSSPLPDLSSVDRGDALVRSRPTWRDDVVEALRQIGGEASLSDIYSRVRDIRQAGHRSLPRSLDAIIRKELEYNSRDSDVFQGEDLFEMPRGKGAGVWRLKR